MNFLTLLPIFSTLINKIFPDPEKQSEAKVRLLEAISNADAKEFEAKSKVIVSEASGSSAAQRNWRPHLMYLFMILIASNYLIFPLIGLLFGIKVDHLDLPPNMWTLLEIAVGGYILGRSGEKIASNFNAKKFYDSVKSSMGSLSQKQVDALNKAIDESRK